jgi:type VI secretion system protein ImpA
MSEELQKPQVLDIDSILEPIAGDNPSGENLRYSGVYDEISEARRADKDVAQGDWKADLKVADFRRVIEIAVPVLTTRSKDLQIAAWLTEALVNEYGFTGLRDGLSLLALIQDKYWETLYPEIDEGDMEGRANAISWIESQAALALTTVPITAGDGYSILDWEDSIKFNLPPNFDSLDSDAQERHRELMAQAETEHRVTGEMWRKAKGQTRRAFYDELNFLLDECAAAAKELDRVNEEKYDRNQMPGLSKLQASLDKVHSQVKKILEEKRLEEPDPAEPGSPAEYSNGEAIDAPAAAGGIGNSAVNNRRDALKHLEQIADFFQRTEPHSPVAYLVQRAVKWGNMPLDSWLQDVIKDEAVLYQLRQTLGIDGTPSADYDTDTSSEETTESTSDTW